MTEKILCTCLFCLEKNPEGRLLSKRTKARHEQKYRLQLEENGMVASTSKKQTMITLKERRPKW